MCHCACGVSPDLPDKTELHDGLAIRGCAFQISTLRDSTNRFLRMDTVTKIVVMLIETNQPNRAPHNIFALGEKEELKRFFQVLYVALDDSSRKNA
jgi:hypothetical protein